MKLPKIDFKHASKSKMDGVMEFILKNKRYFLGGIVFILMMVLLFATSFDKADEEMQPMDGVYQAYAENDNEELDALIRNYYDSYAAGNTDVLQVIATPMCDEEISYIQFYSQYIESFNDIQIFTKRGLDSKSYIVSTIVNLKFVDIGTPAPGFDFFYVETKEDGSLYINNLYGSFNQSNGIYDMDADVTTLIAAFIQQEDVLLKQSEVQQAYNEAVLTDESLNNFVTNTLQTAIVQWNVNYKAELEAAAAAAEAEAAAAAAEAEAAAAAEAQAAAEAEEEANAVLGVTTAKVNVREAADSSSTKIGQLSAKESVTVYAEEGDFYKVNYNGQRAYISKEYIKIQEDAPATETTTATTADNNTTETPATGNNALTAGTEVTLSSTVNIRSAMDASSKKVAVAYQGEKVKVVMSYAEGWTKVTYGKKEGYIKTDLLTD